MFRGENLWNSDRQAGFLKTAIEPQASEKKKNVRAQGCEKAGVEVEVVLQRFQQPAGGGLHDSFEVAEEGGEGKLLPPFVGGGSTVQRGGSGKGGFRAKEPGKEAASAVCFGMNVHNTGFYRTQVVIKIDAQSNAGGGSNTF